MPGIISRKAIIEVHIICSFRNGTSSVEVNSIRRRKMDRRDAHSPVQTRRCMERFPEGSSKSLQRSIIRVEGDFRYRALAVNQLKCGSLEQQSASHCSGSLLHHCPKDPMELRTALVCQPSQVLRLVVSIQRIEQHTR